MSNPRTLAVVTATNMHLHGELRRDQYSCIRDGLSYIETLAERDEVLENMWNEFADVPMNPDTECMEEPFLDFPVGTHRKDIWHWFDERHSKGVAYLLYGDAERTYIVTEWCSNCGSEIEMRWDTDTRGFVAFCPVCGERLVLCDECLHAEDNPSHRCGTDEGQTVCWRLAQAKTSRHESEEKA